MGKLDATDEKTKFKQEYVRVKISCRDLRHVSPCGEGNLGMFIYDFFLEPEIPE